MVKQSQSKSSCVESTSPRPAIVQDMVHSVKCMSKSVVLNLPADPVVVEPLMRAELKPVHVYSGEMRFGRSVGQTTLLTHCMTHRVSKLGHTTTITLEADTPIALVTTSCGSLRPLQLKLSPGTIARQQDQPLKVAPSSDVVNLDCSSPHCGASCRGNNSPDVPCHDLTCPRQLRLSSSLSTWLMGHPSYTVELRVLVANVDLPEARGPPDWDSALSLGLGFPSRTASRPHLGLLGHPISVDQLPCQRKGVG